MESATTDRSESEVEVEEQVISDEGGPEAEPEASSTEENQATAARSQPENEVSEVDIPNVGKILVRSDADGYNEEVQVPWIIKLGYSYIKFNQKCWIF